MAQLNVEHDRHVLGIFPESTWVNALQETGFDVNGAHVSLGATRLCRHQTRGVGSRERVALARPP